MVFITNVRCVQLSDDVQTRYYSHEYGRRNPLDEGPLVGEEGLRLHPEFTVRVAGLEGRGRQMSCFGLGIGLGPSITEAINERCSAGQVYSFWGTRKIQKFAGMIGAQVRRSLQENTHIHPSGQQARYAADSGGTCMRWTLVGHIFERFKGLDRPSEIARRHTPLSPPDLLDVGGFVDGVSVVLDRLLEAPEGQLPRRELALGALGSSPEVDDRSASASASTSTSTGEEEPTGGC